MCHTIYLKTLNFRLILLMTWLWNKRIKMTVIQITNMHVCYFPVVRDKTVDKQHK